MKKPIRCIVCRTEFTEKELENTTGCPVCGFEGLTMLTDGDVNIDINWFEIRLICMWAEALVVKLGDEHSLNAFYSTIYEIQKQLPSSGKITMFDKPPIMKDDSLPPEGTLLN